MISTQLEDFITERGRWYSGRENQKVLEEVRLGRKVVRRRLPGEEDSELVVQGPQAWDG